MIELLKNVYKFGGGNVNYDTKTGKWNPPFFARFLEGFFMRFFRF